MHALNESGHVWTPEPSRSASIPPRALVRLALYVLLAVILIRTTADPDLWGHVLFGRDILAQEAVPRTDPYSFTSDREWVNHEWLAEVSTYAAYWAGGSPGLVALKFAVVLVTFAIVRRVLRRGGVTRPVSDALLVVAAVGSLARLPFVRPQIFSLLLFTAELAVLVAAERGRRRGLLWLPLIFALWANLHGGFIVGLGVLGIWVGWDLFTGPAGWRRLGVISALVAAVAATAINPYGPALWRFLWETVEFGRPTIIDWLPLYRSPVLLALWAVPAATAVFVLVRAGRPENWSHFIIVGMLAVASLRVSRLDAFFCLSVVLLLGPRLGQVWPERAASTSRARSSLSPGARCVTAVAAAAILVPVGVNVGTDVGCIGVEAPLFPEPEAVRFIRMNHLRGRMFTFFDYGEYAIWHLAPDIRVSMDGRRETVYSEGVISNHWKAYHDKGEASRYAEALRADYAWMPQKAVAVEDLEQHGWIRIFDGGRSVVLSRSRPPALIQPRLMPLRRCFPGP